MHFQIPVKQWTKIEEYLDALPQEKGVGIKKEEYLDLMEQMVALCDLPTLEEADSTSSSQLLLVLATLLAHERKGELKSFFDEKMTKAREGQEGLFSEEAMLALSLEKDATDRFITETDQALLTDENGMVAEGENPTVFDDMVARFHLQIREHLGGAVDKEGLRKAGVWSLMMQSASGQIPYGGRTNQPPFGEALLASLLEYEAGKQAEEGNFVLAGRMRRGARLATESLQEALLQSEAEKEALLSAAAFLAGAVLFAHEDLPEHPAPCEKGGYLLSLSQKFHQIFANVGGYSLQIDANGDGIGGATGLGRIQKRGIPECLGISFPFGKDKNAFPTALGIGWDDGEGGVQYLSELSDIKHALSVEKEKADKLKFTLTYTGNSLKNCGGIMESYSLDEGGLRYSAKLLDSECKAVYAKVPLFVTDGKRESKIKQKAGQTNVYLEEFRWRVTTTASLRPDEVTAENRNGTYKIATFVQLEPKIRMNLSLCRENERE